jgi:tetratricopeptide (TPR) repeat protein
MHSAAIETTIDSFSLTGNLAESTKHLFDESLYAVSSADRTVWQISSRTFSHIEDSLISYRCISVANFNRCEMDYISEALVGAQLVPQAVQELELRLKEQPEDMAVRATLVGYYFSSRFEIRDHSKNFRDHLHWLIKNKPDEPFLGTPFGQLISSVEGVEAYAEGKRLWLEQVQKNPDSLLVLEHAASYLFLEDRDLAETYLKRCRDLEPENAHWPGLLAQLYELPKANSATVDKDKSKKAKKQRTGSKKPQQQFIDAETLARAKAAFAERERAFSLATEESTVLYTLTDLPQSAVNCGEIEKAKLYADRLLDLIDQHLANRNYSNSLFEAHTALGRIALLEGNLELAKEHLLKSVSVTGSPQLNSFGPDMVLAQELLNAGEKEIIYEFFFRVRLFWKSECIDFWADKIRSGEIPDLSIKFIPEGERI